MPITEEEEEILFHNPAALKQTPDSADPRKSPAPPSRQVVRPSVEGTPEVIRQQSAARVGIPSARAVESTPAEASAPAPPAADSGNARAEFAAASARARAAVEQMQQRSQPAPAAPQAQDEAASPPANRRSAGTGRSRIPASRPATESPEVMADPVQAPAKPQPGAVSPEARPRARSQTPEQVPVERQPTPEPAPAAAPVRARAQVLSEPEPAPVSAAPVAPAADARAQSEPRQKRSSGSKFLLHTHGLKKVYDGRAVVNGVEITVRPSEIVGLLGPNGAGKTTTFYMIVGLIQPNGGTVSFDGKDATNQPMYRRARLGMGYLPQEESIFRKLSVEDNILAVMETQDIPRSERRDRCNELMKRFGIERLARNEAITLSGGEKRRLTIARSLVTSPKLLMLDEPFSGVDPIAVGEIQEIVRSLREQGLAILITDHNVRETLDIVDRAYLLFEGRVEREGTRDFLINDPLSRQLYLGERFSM